MISLICFLLAAAIFAATAVRAENREHYYKAGVCVIGCVCSLLWVGITVILQLVAGGWQP